MKLQSSPHTEGVKYAGSKLRLIPHILQLAKRTGARTVLDGFSGTTRVSQALAKCGYSVVSNDIAVWSKVFGIAYLLNTRRREAYQPLIDHLNSIPPVDGWFTEHYGGQPNRGCSVQRDGRKKPWQIHNTRKLDAVREEIEKIDLDVIEKSVALTSLMLALDRVDNSLGHFSSYLKQWSPRSYKEMILQVPELFVSDQEHEVHRKDIFCLIPSTSVDLAYFDPPYGSNNEKMPPSRVRYGAYYHLWKSVCLFDKPEIFGKSNRRKDTSDKLYSSVFEDYRKNSEGRYIAVEAIERLFQEIKSQWIILSYSSGGRATARELKEVLSRIGELREVIEIPHKKNVMSDMRWTHDWTPDTISSHKEFLFLLEKKG